MSGKFHRPVLVTTAAFAILGSTGIARAARVCAQWQDVTVPRHCEVVLDGSARTDYGTVRSPGSSTGPGQKCVPATSRRTCVAWMDTNERQQRTLDLPRPSAANRDLVERRREMPVREERRVNLPGVR